MRRSFKRICSIGLALLPLAWVGGLSAQQPPASFTFAVYGDCRTQHDKHAQVVAQILKLNPAFVLNTGDLVEHGSRESEWKTFDRVVAPLRAKMPFYPARGNHDVGSDAFYAERFKVPEGSGSPFYYSFDYGNAHFVAVDTQISFAPGSAQHEWLKRDLAATQAQHTFVFLHKPPYSIGLHGSDFRVRKHLCPLFRQHKVRIVFAGHDHLYYRTVRGGVSYVVTGGGGAPLYSTLNQREAIRGDKWVVRHHCLLVTVSGQEVEVRMVDITGKERDRFEASG